MDEGLKRLVFERLQSSGSLDKDFSVYVIAACEGRDELEASLGAPAGKSSEPPGPPAPSEPVGAYIRSLTVQGFRGIGSERTLTFVPGPGLTLVVGRNGSGKSSLAEALEVLLTGNSKRFEGRTNVWREGWRNLHKPHPVVIEAELLLEGEGRTRVSATWDKDASLELAKTTVQPHGKPQGGREVLDWDKALTVFRPFLSYNELRSMLEDGPSKLYDALSLALGLEDLVSAQKALADARLARNREFDAVKTHRSRFVDELRNATDASDDERIHRCLDALSVHKWDLDTVEALTTTEHGATTADLEVLQRAAALEAPEHGRVEPAIAALQEAAGRLDSLAGTDAARAREVIGLLERAVVFHEHHGDADCPVCGQTAALTSDWHERALAQIDELRELARASDEAHEAADGARRTARDLVGPPPGLLGDLDRVGIDATEVRDRWTAWRAGAATDDLRALARHLENETRLLAESIGTLVEAADAELARRQDVWLPIATRLAPWVPQARAATQAAERINDIKAAEVWLKAATAEIRNERFAPIAGEAMATWAHLRRNSNVELGKVQLTGSGTQRKVTLDVTVDGVPGAALGVMSQGELHSLALSLFLPRARLPESPFRFVVIDDPVQSMDPARVDGLARALEETATDRQVIVLTHDDRLSEAVRRLGIEARHVAVARKPRSEIELRETRHPALAYFEDAHAVIRTEELPDDVRKRIVPGMCRLALEAACAEVVRRRRLVKGEPHDQVEELLIGAGTLRKRMALAFFDDVGSTGDVAGRMNALGRWAGDVYFQVNKGAHQPYQGDLLSFARDAERLVKQVLELR